jgi:hypothetical protein
MKAFIRLVIVLLMVASASAVVFIAARRPAQSPDPPGESKTVYTTAQCFVMQGLKEPNTAKFPDLAEAKLTPLGPHTWRVQAWVDAQDTFGAPVRDAFVCQITRGADGRWRLDGVSFGP